METFFNYFVMKMILQNILQMLKFSFQYFVLHIIVVYFYFTKCFNSTKVTQVVNKYLNG